MEDKQFEKCITDYYICLSMTDDKFKEFIKSIELPLNSLKNEIEQLRLVSDNNLDKAELYDIDEFRGKLIFKMNVAIEDEISLVYGICLQINNVNEGLKNKYEKLMTARNKVDLNKPEMKELVIGTPQRPRLDLLMEWAVDSFKYYNEFNSRINRCVKSLDCKKDETVVNLIESFNEEKTKRANIDRILGFTQFLTNENRNNK